MLCANFDVPDLWFERAYEEQAKAICLHCPAKVACMEQAEREEIEYGVWGGVGALDRALARWAKLTHEERIEQYATYSMLLVELGVQNQKIADILGMPAPEEERKHHKTEAFEPTKGAVIELHRAGRMPHEIADQLGINRRRVHRALAQYRSEDRGQDCAA